jgi:hypothetical protein
MSWPLELSAVKQAALVRDGQLSARELVDGIPIGVQLVGPPGRDDLALSLAGQLEAAIGRHPAGIATPVAAYAQSTT